MDMERQLNFDSFERSDATAVEEEWSPSESQRVDLREIGLILRRHLRVSASIFGIGMLVAILAMLLVTKRYTATSEILINPPRQNIVDIDAFEQGTTSQSGFIDSQVEILRSRSLMARVVEKLDLVNDPEFSSLQDKSKSFLDLLKPSRWLAALGSYSDDHPSASLDQTEKERTNVVDTLLADTKAQRQGLSYVIRVSATSISPDKAALIANNVADLYLVDQLEWRVDAMKQTSDWLGNRVSDLREKLMTSERALEIYRTEHNLVAVSGQTTNDQQRSEINAQLVLARANLAEKEARYKRVQDILSSGGNPDVLAEVLSSQVIVQLRQQQAELARQQADLETRYGDRYPKIVNIKAQIHDLDQQINAEVNRIVANFKGEVEVGRERLKSLQKSLSDLDRQVGVDQQALVHLHDLERQVDANQQLYEGLLESYKKSTALSGSDNLRPVARQISKAVAPDFPSFPKKSLFLAAGFVLSALTGIGAAFLLEALDSGFRTGARLEETLGVPHIASLPLVSRSEIKRANVSLLDEYVIEKPLSSFAEGYRKLKLGLELANVDSPPKVILVTSSLPNEGKTTSSACLARMAAQSGLKTLLIDADLRHPNLHHVHTVKVESGIVDVLKKKMPLEDAILRDESTGLELLFGNSVPTNSADLLGSMAMLDLLAQARRQYDFVVLDSAPVLAVVDSLVLAKHVDEVAFFVRWEKTPREAAESAVKLLRQHGASIAGAVLSMVDARHAARQGRTDAYYYYGHYGAYYGD